MTPNEYERATTDTAIYPEMGTGSLVAVNYCMLGLGESGECQGKLKKVWRGDISLDDQREKLIDELGDVLWYVTRAAVELGSSLDEVMCLNVDKLQDRKNRGVLKGSGDNR